jgi:hypothetical protein
MPYTSGKLGRASILRDEFYNVQCKIDLLGVVMHFHKQKFVVSWDVET